MLEPLIQRLDKVGKAYLSKSKSGKFKSLTITGFFVFNLITTVVESQTKVTRLFEYKACERRALLGQGICHHPAYVCYENHVCIFSKDRLMFAKSRIETKADDKFFSRCILPLSSLEMLFPYIIG